MCVRLPLEWIPNLEAVIKSPFPYLVPAIGFQANLVFRSSCAQISRRTFASRFHRTLPDPIILIRDRGNVYGT